MDRRVIHEMGRDIPVVAEADVLVVGGGPAGLSAAVATARLGARALVTERYGPLGGLASGGQVIVLDDMANLQERRWGACATSLSSGWPRLARRCTRRRTSASFHRNWLGLGGAVVENLLVAGRCFSATSEAQKMSREIPPMMVVGQAAGVAAALAVRERVAPRHVDIWQLQAALSAQGAILGANRPAEAVR